MRPFRRRRKAAFFLTLVASGFLVFLHSHMASMSGDVMSGSDVKHRDGRRGQMLSGHHKGQTVFKDLVTKSLRSLPQIPKTEVIEVSQNASILSCNESRNASEIFKKTHTMTIHGGGRLGNAMFQYASLVGISSFHGYTATIASSHFLRRIFKLKAPATKNLKTQTKAKREKSPGMYDQSIQHLSHNVNWSLVGYYQSWKYFGNISETIREEFTFQDEVIKDMLKEAPVLANWTRITIGVHVRRGDMASKYERDRGYNVADVGFLNRSMNYFRKKYENPLFIVCSDSVTWCKDNLMSDDTIFTKGRREVDLAILAHCDHNIVTSGSFGWWGAWLAGGDVVYFKNFPREKTWLDRQYTKEDYYPDEWLGMQ
ncbi:galactoside alpha-(1,2)-fucosyltransferase 1-like [Haliotis rufescens]|uniref:galactoside alpha-(1,2)-fucosyltransferase 1-like n=1 Tax=Haliotis rufescens TaxID=6454 RepID=UPI001EB063D0|nr:galactoside alpha-(1,2)-fucosyltransferase 1-like [Haliotis rufescens]XP_048242737.1 galactoside alpha-(1,2)-fucosyltransferase 1-like [Haliotis rufescens]XP_048242738.1 galactoside alpha-(1,2)-fucosyltransferase 1-like [Haliotis rufescens]XP_048242739.1 galactoside alpha-(1,2)-fucosyltransferase 1-like [Haliotis rufescens]XP_048251737.1 galactoside alpha-(1,2)-fucosyltransferase 1-like [Haliotis rufescens]XP_048251738.1 galactoside alpha-(1,2)-fucosyltransferase 1-like [Haliotis rufescens]